MPAFVPGDRPPRLHIDRERIAIPGGGGERTETITIMNDGGGILRGSAISDSRWIHIPNPRIETPFILPFRIEITPDRITPGSGGTGKVSIITNGGSSQVIIDYIAHPEPKPTLILDERQFQFCNLRKGDDVCFDMILRNSGSGVLSGTIESGSDWIEVKTRTIWTRTVQAVPVIIHTSQAPGVRQPVGWIRIRSSGGTEEVPVSLHFRGGIVPRIRLDPAVIRCTWEKRGIIEETLTISNVGEGILRGTIPSPSPWLKIIPSIFSAVTRTKIIIRIDTRMLPAEGTQSVSIPIITNTGKDTFTVEVTPGLRTFPQVRRTRTSVRQVPRTRLTAYDPDGRAYILLTSGRSGGEGEIYHLPDDSTRCAKIFHPHRRTPEIEEKIRSMIQTPPTRDLLSSLTWPEKPLTDLPKGGRVIGYLMRRISDDYRSAHLWYDETPGTSTGVSRIRIRASYQLARIVAGIHAAGHVIGDLRENNLLVSETGNLIMIDTDSFQITEPKSRRIFWSKVGTGEYLPPEHLDGSFAVEGCNRIYGDYFALAVLIFRFLMDGVHPFQAKGPLVRDAPATTDKIELGYFSYEKRQAGITPPDYAPPYDRVPPALRSLFRDTFVTGHRSPSARPDPMQWVSILRTLIPDKLPAGEKEERVSPPESPGPKSQADRPGYTDTSGAPILVGPCCLRTSDGIIASCQIPGDQVFLRRPGFGKESYDQSIPPVSVPPSLVLPKSVLIKEGEGPVGWVIPEIDPERYHHWHVMADPESRVRTGVQNFAFNRRIASCRNLMAAVISARRIGVSCSITERSVFVGPDASIRILCLPDIRNEESDRAVSPGILIFRMLMNGFHPYHAVGKRTKGYGSHERRMKANLYPWAEPEPELRPHIQAPPKPTLPDSLWFIFDQEFRNYRDGKKDKVSPETWFSALDSVYRNLIRCTRHTDHWYLPGEHECPWCGPIHKQVTKDLSLRVRQLPSAPALLCLMSPKLAGLLTMPSTPRKASPDTSPRWRTIPLPAERRSCISLPAGSVILALPPGKITFFLVQYQRGWLICIQKPRTDLVAIQEISNASVSDQNRVPQEIYPYSEAVKTFCQEITVIDEMRWISAMDRLRGEGIGQPRRRRKSGIRTTSPRRQLIQIMLHPIDIPWSEPEKIPEPFMATIQGEKKKKSGKQVNRKTIRGRLQTILRDFIGSEPELPESSKDENKKLD